MLGVIALVNAVTAGEMYGAAPVQMDASGRAVVASVGEPRHYRLASGEVLVGEVKSVSLHSTSGDYMDQLTFSMNNVFNTSTEPLEMDSSTVNLWSGVWVVSPIAAPCNGEFKPLKAGALNYGFQAGTNPLDPKNPHLINGSFIIRPKPCTNCGNFSQGFAAYAFAMIPLSNGGNEIIVETAGSITDDMYSEDFASIVGGEMVHTLVLKHRDCDPEGYSKCHSCTCPDSGKHV
mmetsp:Transcript_117762/g.165560  ORF Transcript_117762/g.165560 Transcript_117762/m.165560 type:complete len:233 (+) Transcript_117762:3-701(+)